MNKCPKCGTECQGRFCPECGTKIPDERICPNCGRKSLYNAKFCSSCGYSFLPTPQPVTTPKQPPKKRRKAPLIALLSILLILAIGVGVGIPLFMLNRHNGTYYLYEGESYNYEKYYILKGNSYTDDTGYSCDVEFDGNQIKLYAELFGVKDVFASGTIDGNVIRLKIMGAEVIYAKKGAMHEHEFGDWRVQTPSTCVEYGTERRFCKGCGKTEMRSIPLAPHEGDWNITKEATCTETGTREVHCTVCLQYIVETVDMIAHRSDSWETDDSAHWQICTMCKEEFNRGEHNVDHDVWKYGQETHWHPCTICGRKYEEAAHTYSDNDWCDICGLETGTYGLKFVLRDGGYAVTGIGECTASEIVIPNVHGKNHLPVTTIANSAFYNCYVKKIMIPDSVTSIGDSAFEDCSRLTSITIPDGVTSIGVSAFAWCGGLTEITIPNSVTSIGEGAFNGCSRLTEIKVDENNPIYHAEGNCLIETKSKTLIAGCKTSVIPNDGSVTSIGAYAFAGCFELTVITIPDSVTSIGYSAFYECIGLTLVTIGNGVTSIGDEAFIYCVGLTEIMIPDSVTSIGQYAFAHCSGLTSVTIGSGVTSIGGYAFGDCSELKEVHFENPNQWKVLGISEDMSDAEAVSGLNDPAKAAEYLTDCHSRLVRVE